MMRPPTMHPALVMRAPMVRALVGCFCAVVTCSAGEGEWRGQRLQEVGAVWEVSEDELGPCPEAQCGQEGTTFTRFVMCMEGGAVVEEANCLQEKPATSLVCPASAPCVEYTWQAGEFGTCDASCGAPARTLNRTVQCVGDDGSTGEMSSCTGAKPTEVLQCDASAPCVYSWKIAKGACPVDCGTAASTVEREFVCEDSDSSAVPDSSCAEPRPPTEHDCPATPACITYEWAAQDFDPCPTACGLAASTSMREVTCRGSDDSVGVDANCTLDSRPPSTMECPATAACITYTWMGMHFDECPSDCGLPATRLTRAVTCLSSDGHPAVEEMCTAAKPPTEHDCPATPACITYEWAAQDFDPCPTVCGLAASTLTREVTCRGSDDSVGVDANCALDSRPPSTMECPLTANCEWHYTAFEACPSDCGLEASTVRRVVECADPADTTVVVESARCNYEDKPATGHYCEATARCVIYEWEVPSFTDCDTSCGLPLAILHRSVTCKGDDGSIASTSSSCGLPIPAEAQTCQATPQCTAAEMVEYLKNNPDCQVGEIVFNYDIETSGRVEFEDELKAELGRFLGIAAARVLVLQIKAGSTIVVFAIRKPGPLQGESDRAASVSSAEAMRKLSRAMKGHYDEGSPRLLDETEFAILSTLRLESGLRTDLRCELAVSSADVADEQIDCDHTDEWSTLKDELEDFAAAPMSYISDPAHLNFVLAVGVGALAVLAMAFCLCRRCCCQSQRRKPVQASSSMQNGAYSQMVEDDRIDDGGRYDVTKVSSYLDDVEGGGSGRGSASGLGSNTPTSADETSTDFDEDEDGEGEEGSAMLSASQMIQADASRYREAVFRGSS